MSATETMIWMAGAAVLWGGMGMVAVRLIERNIKRKIKRMHNDEH